MTEIELKNELEIALDRARRGLIAVSQFLAVFARSDLAVPSGAAVMPDGGGFQPVLFDKNKIKMVACFTSRDRIGEYAAIAPYCLMICGWEFLRRVPDHYGVVINPGLPLGFEIAPEGLPKIVKDFAPNH